eukprot:TRINITY_DN13693_c0_g1_i1.p1 TRINITY_DN13693_c0_g1~~TRINITY_DN13693_c0_g1_i1.p1  ORF type:complete len:105 (-),score=8.78 TRINITY_DN13693_c0_g1_i1:103-417(-)
MSVFVGGFWWLSKSPNFKEARTPYHYLANTQGKVYRRGKLQSFGKLTQGWNKKHPSSTYLIDSPLGQISHLKMQNPTSIHHQRWYTKDFGIRRLYKRCSSQPLR